METHLNVQFVGLAEERLESIGIRVVEEHQPHARSRDIGRYVPFIEFVNDFEEPAQARELDCVEWWGTVSVQATISWELASSELVRVQKERMRHFKRACLERAIDTVPEDTSTIINAGERS